MEGLEDSESSSEGAQEQENVVERNLLAMERVSLLFDR